MYTLALSQQHLVSFACLLKTPSIEKVLLFISICQMNHCMPFSSTLYLDQIQLYFVVRRFKICLLKMNGTPICTVSHTDDISWPPLFLQWPLPGGLPQIKLDGRPHSYTLLLTQPCSQACSLPPETKHGATCLRLYRATGDKALDP